MSFSPLQVEAFWQRVDKSGECWVWTAARQKFGYGILRFEKRGWLAHRVAFLLTNGPITDGLCVLHHCDNPPCCNPAHLFLGTVIDNNKDRDAKGRNRANVGKTMARYPHRRARGERQGSARLTAEAVRDMRDRVAGGELRSDLAKAYGVSWTTVDKAVKRLRWAHV